MMKLLTNMPLRILIAALITVLFFFMARNFQWFSFVDRTIYDLGMVLRTPPDKEVEVVLIAIDKSSLQSCFPASPFPISQHLDLHAHVINRLDSAGASLIVFDILFDQLKDVDDSSLNNFTASMKNSRGVLLAGFIEQERQLNSSTGNEIAAQKLCLPQENIRVHSAGCGLINVPVDNDGSIRRIKDQYNFHGEMIPSFAFAAADVYQRGGISTPLLFDETLLIDYSWSAGAIKKLSYGMVLTGDGWQSTAKGKIAVIGVVENDNMDTYKTPMTLLAGVSNGKMSGAEIHAIAIQTLISGTGIVALTRNWMSTAGILLVLILFLLTLAKTKPLRNLLALAAGLLIIILGAVGLVVVMGYTFTVASLLLTMALGSLIMYTLNMVALKFIHDKQSRIMADVRSDLDSAHDIQERLQPKEFPKSDKYETAGIQIPCKEVGGDYYDIVELPNERLGILIADVAGKGVGGSLIMSNIQGCFRQVAGEFTSPNAVFQRMNDVVKSAANIQHFFVTAFYGILDARNGELIYSNAGHGFPILCSNAGEIELLKGGEVPLGIMPESQWTDNTIKLNIGDILCVYTDGISEASRKGSDEMFEDEGAIACLRKVYQESPQSICDHMLATCRKFAGGEDFDDDWTLLVVKLK